MQDHIESVVEQHREGLITLYQCIESLIGNGLETIGDLEGALDMKAMEIVIALYEECSSSDALIIRLRDKLKNRIS